MRRSELSFLNGCYVTYEINHNVSLLGDKPRITTIIKPFKSNLTLGVVCGFTLEVDDRLTSRLYFDGKF
jgi:hypothetical protein